MAIKMDAEWRTMSLESALKARLSRIAQDGFRVADETEVWPLAVRMMECLGSTDPELRDTLIYRTLRSWSGSYLDTRRLDALLHIALDDAHLTLGLGEPESDAVFMRSFSSLAVALCVAQHRARPYLTVEAVHEAHRRIVANLRRERDLRGYVPGKGWADAVCHGADALDELALCPELGEQGLVDTLQVVRETVLGAPVVFVDEEDERLVTAVLSTVQRGVLSKAVLSQWTLAFAAVGPDLTYREWFWLRANIKRFLRSLYFGSRYRGMADWFEPLLGETLRQISESAYERPPAGPSGGAKTGQTFDEDVEEDEREDQDRDRPEEPLLQRLPGVGDDGQQVVHVARQGERERLPADDDVPAHHEDAEQDQGDAGHGPLDAQPRDEQQDERHEVADAVLQHEHLPELVAVDRAFHDVP